MRIIVFLVSTFVLVVGAQAQNFSPYTLTPVNGAFNGPAPTGAPQPTDDVLVNRFANGVPTTAGLPLADFASAADLQAANGRINQAFQQIQQLQQSAQFQQQVTQAYRGIAAAVAIGSASMPSVPGRFTWAANAATFQGDLGAGFSLAYRLPVSIPIAVTASYGSGGSYANVGRDGLMGEF
jgi:hypothetical protein